jgi:CheY-like chemotaxis protein
VVTASSGPAVIDTFRRRAEDLSAVVLDFSMPNMGGQEVLPQLREIRKDIPVIVSSGYSEAEALRLFSGQEISGFIQKPYSAATLVGKVSKAIRHRYGKRANTAQ